MDNPLWIATTTGQPLQAAPPGDSPLRVASGDLCPSGRLSDGALRTAAESCYMVADQGSDPPLTPHAPVLYARSPTTTIMSEPAAAGATATGVPTLAEGTRMIVHEEPVHPRALRVHHPHASHASHPPHYGVVPHWSRIAPTSTVARKVRPAHHPPIRSPCPWIPRTTGARRTTPMAHLVICCSRVPRVITTITVDTRSPPFHLFFHHQIWPFYPLRVWLHHQIFHFTHLQIWQSANLQIVDLQIGQSAHLQICPSPITFIHLLHLQIWAHGPLRTRCHWFRPLWTVPTIPFGKHFSRCMSTTDIVTRKFVAKPRWRTPNYRVTPPIFVLKYPIFMISFNNYPLTPLNISTTILTFTPPSVPNLPPLRSMLVVHVRNSTALPLPSSPKLCHKSFRLNLNSAIFRLPVRPPLRWLFQLICSKPCNRLRPLRPVCNSNSRNCLQACLIHQSQPDLSQRRYSLSRDKFRLILTLYPNFSILFCIWSPNPWNLFLVGFRTPARMSCNLYSIDYPTWKMLCSCMHHFLSYPLPMTLLPFLPSLQPPPGCHLTFLPVHSAGY